MVTKTEKSAIPGHLLEEISPQKLINCLQKFYLHVSAREREGRLIIASQNCNRW